MATKLRHLAAELCCGRLMFLLEGGYNVDALGEAVTETWLALVGESTKEGSHPLAEPLPQPEPMEDVEDLIQQLKRIHKL